MLDADDQLNIIDVGTGTGAVALTLLLELKQKCSHIKGIDISPAALEVAKKNKEILTKNSPYEQLIHFEQGDRLKNISKEYKSFFHLIISN